MRSTKGFAIKIRCLDLAPINALAVTASRHDFNPEGIAVNSKSIPSQPDLTAEYEDQMFEDDDETDGDGGVGGGASGAASHTPRHHSEASFERQSKDDKAIL